jgi:hypothetical protein
LHRFNGFSELVQVRAGSGAYTTDWERFMRQLNRALAE